MALITVAGPDTQSPPAYMPTRFKAPETSARSFPLFVAIPACSKGSVTISCPTAIRITSHSSRSSALSAFRGEGRPPLTCPIIWGCTHNALALPLSSFSIRRGAFNVRSSIPSAMAPSTSAGRAVISSLRLRYTMLTVFALERIAVLAQSIATLPPPTTMTRFPVKSGYLSSPISRSISTAETTLPLSSPSRFRRFSAWAPIAIYTASYVSLIAFNSSVPTTAFSFTSTPVERMASISSFSLSLGKR